MTNPAPPPNRPVMLPPRTAPAHPPAQSPPVFAVTSNATANSVLTTLDQAIQPFRDPPPPEQGAAGAVAQYLGGALGLTSAPAQFIDALTTQGVNALVNALGIAGLFPALPVAVIGTTMHMGTPHTHVHPPSLVPPAPPIPLPSMGVAFLAGSASVLVNGIPALRAGDVGIGFTCGSLAPPFEIMTGANGVYFGGSRVARIGMDITFHCNPAPMSGPGALAIGMAVAGAVAGVAGSIGQASAGNTGAAIAQAAQAALDAAAFAVSALRGKDPAGPPGIGMLLGPPTTVLAGGPPIPNIGALAQGKIYAAIGRAMRSASQRLRRRSPPPDANGPHCQGSEPVHLVTGANYNTHHDFTSIHRGFRWSRFVTSERAHERGVLGWGWRHVFESRLDVRLHRATFLGFEGERIDFPRLRADEREIRSNGYVLTRLSGTRFRVSHPRIPTLEFVLDSPSSTTARLSSVRSNGVLVDLVYDQHRRLCEILETPAEHGTTARYEVEYDRDGQLAEIRGALRGEKERRLAAYGYDRDGHLVVTEDACAARERFRYDRRHRLIESTDRTGYQYRWEYDSDGRCVLATGEDGLWWARFEYVPEKNLTRTTLHDGSVRAIHYDDDGVITKIVDGLGGVLERIRDEEGRIVAEIDAGGRRTDFLYDEDGAHTFRRDRFGHLSPPALVDGKPPSPFARLLPTTPRDRVFGAQLDVLGEHARAVVRSFLAVVPPELTNIAQRVLRQPPPTSAPPIREYDAHSRLLREVDSYGRLQEWEYDGAGNLVRRRDRDGRQYEQRTTSWNLVGARIDPLGNKVAYTYNPHEHVTSIVDPLGTVSAYDYDSEDRLVRVRRHGRVREEYVYDLGDRLVEKRAGDGRTLLRFEPHDNGLIGRIEFESGGFIELDYDSRGKVTRADTETHRVALLWDSQRRRLREVCDGREVLHVYGAGGPRDTWIAGRFLIRYQRDTSGVLTITDPTGAKRRVQTDKRGLVCVSHPSGTEEIQQYDDDGKLEARLAWKRAQDGALVPWAMRFEYTAEGDLASAYDSARGTRRFEVDAAHRLVGETGPDGTRYAYERDAAGNVLAKPGLPAVELTSGNRLRFVGDEAFEYDDRDHIAVRSSPRGTIRYVRDSFDQLVRIEDGAPEPWTATYDGLGRRISAGRGTRRTSFWWDGDRIAAETAPDGRLRVYVYVDEQALVPIGFVDYESVDAPRGSGRSYTVFTDQVGMPMHIEDAVGRVVWWATRIDPYGAIEVHPSAEIEYRLRWPGHYYDAETGLHYNRFRYYDPRLGRYLESDPIGCAGGVNIYAYPQNPLVSVDVLGLSHNKHNHPTDENGAHGGRNATEGTAEGAPARQVGTPDQETARTAARRRAEELDSTLSRNQLRNARMVAAVHDPETNRTFVADNRQGAAFDPDGPNTHPVVRDRVRQQRERVALAQELHGSGGARALSDAELGERMRARGIPDTPESMEQVRQVSDRAGYREGQLGRPMEDKDWNGMRREVGQHGEVVALNDALNARDEARRQAGRPRTTEDEIGNVALYNQQLTRPAGDPLPATGMPRCDHCRVAVSGVSAHPEVVAAEQATEHRDRARREGGATPAPEGDD